MENSNCSHLFNRQVRCRKCLNLFEVNDLLKEARAEERHATTQKIIEIVENIGKKADEQAVKYDDDYEKGKASACNDIMELLKKQIEGLK